MVYVVVVFDGKAHGAEAFGDEVLEFCDVALLSEKPGVDPGAGGSGRRSCC